MAAVAPVPLEWVAGVSLALILIVALGGCGGGGDTEGLFTPRQVLMYVADTGNNRIVRIEDMRGAGFKTFTNPGFGFGDLNAPYSVDFVSPNPFNKLTFNNIVIADRNNHRIVLTRSDLGAAGSRVYGRLDKRPGNGQGEYNQPSGVRASADYIHVLRVRTRRRFFFVNGNDSTCAAL